MKKVYSKLLSAFLAFFMICGCIPFTYLTVSADPVDEAQNAIRVYYNQMIWPDTDGGPDVQHAKVMYSDPHIGEDVLLVNYDDCGEDYQISDTDKDLTFKLCPPCVPEDGEEEIIPIVYVYYGDHAWTNQTDDANYKIDLQWNNDGYYQFTFTRPEDTDYPVGLDIKWSDYEAFFLEDNSLLVQVNPSDPVEISFPEGTSPSGSINDPYGIGTRYRFNEDNSLLDKLDLILKGDPNRRIGYVGIFKSGENESWTNYFIDPEEGSNDRDINEILSFEDDDSYKLSLDLSDVGYVQGDWVNNAREVNIEIGFFDPNGDPQEDNTIRIYYDEAWWPEDDGGTDIQHAFVYYSPSEGDDVLLEDRGDHGEDYQIGAEVRDITFKLYSRYLPGEGQEPFEPNVFIYFGDQQYSNTFDGDNKLNLVWNDDGYYQLTFTRPDGVNHPLSINVSWSVYDELFWESDSLLVRTYINEPAEFTFPEGQEPKRMEIEPYCSNARMLFDEKNGKIDNLNLIINPYTDREIGNVDIFYWGKTGDWDHYYYDPEEGSDGKEITDILTKNDDGTYTLSLDISWLGNVSDGDLVNARDIEINIGFFDPNDDPQEDNTIRVYYDEAWWPEDDGGTDIQHGFVYYVDPSSDNDLLLRNHSDGFEDLNIRTEDRDIALKLFTKYEGNDPAVPIVFVYCGDKFWSSLSDNEDDKIDVTWNSEGYYELTFVRPANNNGITFDIKWSLFDEVYLEPNTLLVETSKNYGQIDLADGYSPVRAEDEPQTGRTRYRFDETSDVLENIEFIIKPDKGCTIGNIDVWYPDSKGPTGEDWLHYCYSPQEGSNSYDINDVLTDNNDGTYTFYYDLSVVKGSKEDWIKDQNARHLNINVNFNKFVDANGIRLDTRDWIDHEAGKITYSLDDAVAVNVDIGTDDHGNRYFEDIPLQVYENANKIKITYTPNDKFINDNVRGIELHYFDGKEIRRYLPFDEGEGKSITITKPDSGWSEMEVRLFNEGFAYDGTFCVHIMGEARDLRSTGIDIYDDDPVDFTVNSPVEFTLSKDVYAVYIRTSDGSVLRKIEPSGKKYSYTPSSTMGFEIKIYIEDEDYRFDNLDVDWEHGDQCWDFFFNYDGEIPDELRDQVEINVLNDEHIKDWSRSGDRVRVVYHWDYNELFDEHGRIGNAIVKIKVNYPNDPKNGMTAEYQIGNEEGLFDSGNIFDWDVTDSIKGDAIDSYHFQFHYSHQAVLEVNKDDFRDYDVSLMIDNGQEIPYSDPIELTNDIEEVWVIFKAKPDASVPDHLVLRVKNGPDGRVKGVWYPEYDDENNVYIARFFRNEGWNEDEYIESAGESIGDGNYEIVGAWGSVEDDVKIDTLNGNAPDFGEHGNYNWGDTVSVKVKSGTVYAMEAQFSEYGIENKLLTCNPDTNTWTLDTDYIAGFRIMIYTSKEMFDFMHLWPNDDQFVVQYYTETESDDTGKVLVEGEISRVSFEGWTKVAYKTDDATARITVEPTDDYLYEIVWYNDDTVIPEPVEIKYTDDWYDNCPRINFFEKEDIGDAVISPIEDQIFTGSEITPAVVVTLNGNVLGSEDYTVTYSDNIQAGTARVTVTGKGIYKGSPDEVTFEIKPLDIKDAIVSPIEDQTYTGSAITPAVTVTLNGKVLTDKDYSVEYSNNTQVGCATVKVTGVGNYTGSPADATFNIVQTAAPATPTATTAPAANPTAEPTAKPTDKPADPTTAPTVEPTKAPAANPTTAPQVTLKLDKTTAEAVCGKTISLTATVTGSTDKISWQSSDNKVASVDNNGKIKAKMAGAATITATVAGVSATCNVTVLYKDVTNTKDFWYEPTYYLTKSGVAKGYDKQTLFKPTNDCSRAQMVTFLWRLAGEPEPKSKTTSFKDVKAKDYFYKPVLWAVEKGITTGVSKKKFDPQGICTRAQTVTFLWRMAGKPKPKSKTSKFKDVKSKDYFFTATIWASEKKIVAGYSDGTFKPQGKCLRRQMVTFLYKYDKYTNGKG